MEKLFSFLINFIDKNYHQKKIFSFLNRLNIQIIFDIGAHKGEFLRSIKKLKKVNKIYSFEPQKKVFDNLNLLNKGLAGYILEMRYNIRITPHRIDMKIANSPTRIREK